MEVVAGNLPYKRKVAEALPAFLLAMYEKDGLPPEKVVKNIIRARYLRLGVRPYKTGNIYAPFTGQAGKEAVNGKHLISGASAPPPALRLSHSPSLLHIHS